MSGLSECDNSVHEYRIGIDTRSASIPQLVLSLGTPLGMVEYRLSVEVFDDLALSYRELRKQIEWPPQSWFPHSS